MNDQGLSIWTIYDHPVDAPTVPFLARRFEVMGPERGPTEDIMRASDIEALREVLMEMGLTRLYRDDADDPHIVESWI